MIYRVPGFLAVVTSSPHPIPLSRQQVVSLSQSSCVLPVELTDGRGWEGVGEEPNHTRRESLVLYESFNALWLTQSTPLLATQREEIQEREKGGVGHSCVGSTKKTTCPLRHSKMARSTSFILKHTRLHNTHPP